MNLWSKHTNEELALNLELWLDLDGQVQDERQVKFFQEVIFRLMAMNYDMEKDHE